MEVSMLIMLGNPWSFVIHMGMNYIIVVSRLSISSSANVLNSGSVEYNR